MTDSDISPQACVGRGISYLHENASPNWWEHLNLVNLDMESGRWCILGQIHFLGDDQPSYGDYEEDKGVLWCKSHGFLAPAMWNRDAIELKREWIKQLGELQTS